MISLFQLGTSLLTNIGSGLVLVLIILLYGWLALRAARKSQLKQQAFTIIDAIAASILALWLISTFISSFGKDQTITLSVILANCLLYCCIILGILGFLSLRHISPIATFGLAPSHPGRIAKITLLWFISCYPLIAISQSVMQVFSKTEDDAQAIVRYFLDHPGWHERISIIAMAVIVAPIAEELIFRGYLYGVMRRFTGRFPAMIASSLLFAAIHLHLPSFLGLTILAMILCLLYERTGSLWSNIFMHSIFNAFSIIMLLIFKEAAL